MHHATLLPFRGFVGRSVRPGHVLAACPMGAPAGAGVRMRRVHSDEDRNGSTTQHGHDCCAWLTSSGTSGRRFFTPEERRVFPGTFARRLRSSDVDLLGRTAADPATSPSPLSRHFGLPPRAATPSCAPAGCASRARSRDIHDCLEDFRGVLRWSDCVYWRLPFWRAAS